jgi:DNA-binding transcriptional ArsR family regulator
MSQSIRKRTQDRAAVFAALGDETRLSLVVRLCRGEPQSITQLTAGSLLAGSKLTRQAVTKHLRVLEGVGIVRGVRVGRENLFEFDPRPVDAMKQYLESVSASWDRKLGRLKALVEE